MHAMKKNFTIAILLLLSLLIPQFFCGETYYDYLEISKDADIHTINLAYNNLSEKYHPDKNPGNPEAYARYLNIKKAHEILTNK